MYSLHTFLTVAKTASEPLPRSLRGLLTVPLTLLLAPAAAQKTTPVSSFDSTRRLSQVEVIGQATVAQSALTDKTVLSAELSANPALVSLMGRDYISKQAIASYGDLLRPLAGVNVSNFQIGGVDYGIQMRGHTVTEHARDIVFTVDGVVQNQGLSIQTNGYVDLNPLILETIQRLEVVRGPFSSFYGDHTYDGGRCSGLYGHKAPESYKFAKVTRVNVLDATQHPLKFSRTEYPAIATACRYKKHRPVAPAQVLENHSDLATLDGPPVGATY